MQNITQSSKQTDDGPCDSVQRRGQSAHRKKPSIIRSKKRQPKKFRQAVDVMQESSSEESSSEYSSSGSSSSSSSSSEEESSSETDSDNSELKDEVQDPESLP